MKKIKLFAGKLLRKTEWHFSFLGFKNQRKIKKYYDFFSGERCFIIGNGPSLKGMNLSFLKNEITFGLNRIYLMYDDLGFETTFLVSVNPLVIEQFSNDLIEVNCPKFFSWENRRLISPTENTMFLRSYPSPKFSIDLCDSIWQGTTVTYVAMQIAYYMGFKKVYLLGVDHSFQTQGKPHKVIISKSDDRNHFHPDYFGKGIRWQLPDLQTSELAYMMAKYQFEKQNRRIIDATVGGKLQVFEKVEYNSLFR